MKKINVAIIGSGNIGTDLLIKLQRSHLLKCVLFIGKNASSKGINLAKSLGVTISCAGSQALINNAAAYDIAFDASSAQAHSIHASSLKQFNKTIIDLTPARLGRMCIPLINMEECLEEKNISMLTCGGQSTIPLAYTLKQTHSAIEYIEVVSSISAESAGLATRNNIDEYIKATEEGLIHFSGCQQAKAILIVNPAEPGINMQSTLYAKIQNPDMQCITEAINQMVNRINKYVPGYELIVQPRRDQKVIMMTVKVRGQGDYLPPHAGNLDIITSASVFAGEQIAKQMLLGVIANE